MTRFYAFLMKEMNGSWRILEIRPINSFIDDFLKLHEYDMAFPISRSAVVMYYDLLKSANNFIRIKKDFCTEEITEEDFIIHDHQKALDKAKKAKEKNMVKDEDLVNEEIFDQKKSEMLRKVLFEWFKFANVFDLMKFYAYFDLNNHFASAGYFITDENKEDIFIQVIEKEDFGLLDKLEDFLTIKQEIQEFKGKFGMYFKLKETFDLLSYWDFNSIEEATEALEEKIKEIHIEYKVDFNKEEFMNLISDIHSASISHKKLQKAKRDSRKVKDLAEEIKSKAEEKIALIVENSMESQEKLLAEKESLESKILQLEKLLEEE